jgi:hypothetical protein
MGTGTRSLTCVAVCAASSASVARNRRIRLAAWPGARWAESSCARSGRGGARREHARDAAYGRRGESRAGEGGGARAAAVRRRAAMRAGGRGKGEGDRRRVLAAAGCGRGEERARARDNLGGGWMVDRKRQTSSFLCFLEARRLWARLYGLQGRDDLRAGPWATGLGFGFRVG